MNKALVAAMAVALFLACLVTAVESIVTFNQTGEAHYLIVSVVSLLLAVAPVVIAVSVIGSTP